MTFNPHFAFNHAYGVARYQRRQMHVVTAVVRRSEMRRLQGWFGSTPAACDEVTSPPIIGAPCTAADVEVGDWMALPSVGDGEDSPQFWRRCVDRDLESVWWEAPAGRFSIPLQSADRVSHRLPNDSEVCGRYFNSV